MPPQPTGYTPPHPSQVLQMFVAGPGPIEQQQRPGAHLGLKPNFAAMLCYVPFVGVIASILLAQSEPRGEPLRSIPRQAGAPRPHHLLDHDRGLRDRRAAIAVGRKPPPGDPPGSVFRCLHGRVRVHDGADVPVQDDPDPGPRRPSRVTDHTFTLEQALLGTSTILYLDGPLRLGHREATTGRQLSEAVRVSPSPRRPQRRHRPARPRQDARQQRPRRARRRRIRAAPDRRPARARQHPPKLRRLIEMMGLDRLFAIVDTEDEALAAAQDECSVMRSKASPLTQRSALTLLR
jgi:hypothetical protein